MKVLTSTMHIINDDITPIAVGSKVCIPLFNKLGNKMYDGEIKLRIFGPGEVPVSSLRIGVVVASYNRIIKIDYDADRAYFKHGRLRRAFLDACDNLRIGILTTYVIDPKDDEFNQELSEAIKIAR